MTRMAHWSNKRFTSHIPLSAICATRFGQTTPLQVRANLEMVVPGRNSTSDNESRESLEYRCQWKQRPRRRIEPNHSNVVFDQTNQRGPMARNHAARHYRQYTRVHLVRCVDTPPGKNAIPGRSRLHQPHHLPQSRLIDQICAEPLQPRPFHSSSSLLSIIRK